MPYPVSAARGSKIPSPAALSPLLTGLTHYWKLDEASGVRHDSVGTIHLTPSANDPASVAGVVGNCADFEEDNTNRLTSSTVIPFNGDFSIAFWVNVEEYTSGAGIYLGILLTGGVWGQGNGIELLVAYNNALAFLYYNGSNNDIAIIHANLRTAGLWTYVVFTHSAAAKRIECFDSTAGYMGYRDGLTYAWTNGAPSSVGFHIGKATPPMDGKIDEYGIWNRVLTLTEMGTLYSGGLGKTYPFA